MTSNVHGLNEEKIIHLHYFVLLKHTLCHRSGKRFQWKKKINVHTWNLGRLKLKEGYKVKNSKLCVLSNKQQQRKNNVVYFVSEPISAKSPTIQADNKFIRIERRVNQPMALFCNSQSFPVPVFRFVETKKSQPNSMFFQQGSKIF